MRCRWCPRRFLFINLFTNRYNARVGVGSPYSVVTGQMYFNGLDLRSPSTE